MTIATPTNGGQSTQTTPVAVEKEEIWSTILTGVASSKMVPTKKLLVLGIVAETSCKRIVKLIEFNL
jgi:dynein light intermediate chain 1